MPADATRLAVLIGLQGESPRPVPASSPASAGFFKHLGGMDSEAEFMDYTDDV